MIQVSVLSARSGSFQLSDVSFEVPQGGYGIVIGPAGSGKTTLIDTIAGLLSPRSGRVILGGEDVTRRAPEDRRIGVVYQHAYLFPHLSVAANVVYGAANQEAADEMVERFGIAALAGRAPGSLSGGERQLVALARALARRPEVLLLDEPFAALDNRSRARARRALRSLYVERRFTVLHVTHDFTEAGMLGDVVVLMDGGRVLQTGAPEELFRRPANAYIADFLGADNVFAGVTTPIDGAVHGDQAAAAAFHTGALTLFVAGEVVKNATHAVLRAEEVILSSEPAASSIRNQFRGTVTEVVRLGAVTRVTVDVSGTPLVAAVTSRSAEELALGPGKEVVAAFKATAVHLC